MFRDHVVDGEHIPAVTHFFYGIAHLYPQENVVLNRTKQLTHSDIELFEDVYCLGRKFIESASLLPFLPAREFACEEKRFEKGFEKAREKPKKSCPLYFAYSELQNKLPQSIAGDIVAFCHE